MNDYGRTNYDDDMSLIQDSNKKSLCKQRFCYHGLCGSFQIAIIVVSFIIMYATFGVDLVIIGTTLIILGILILFVGLITSLMYAINKCCKKDEVLQYNYISFTCNIICLWYLCQLCILFIVCTILIVLYHPYLKGPFDEIFLKNGDITLRNYWQTVEYTGNIIYPKSVSEIQNIILNEGINNGKRIIAVGSAHSSAPLFNDDIMISVNNFNNISINNNTGIPSVIVGAGAILKDVEDYLFENGYVLLGFGNTQSQTMAGMLGTSVYGIYGSMNKYLLNAWFVDGNGNDLYVTKLDNSSYISALKTSLGVLGVIYQLEFMIEPTFNIKKSDESLGFEIFKTATSAEFDELFFPNDPNILGRRVRMYPTGYFLETYTNVTDPATIIDRERNDNIRSLINNYLLVLECLIPETSNICDRYEWNLETNNIDNDVYVAKTSSMSDNIFHGGFLYVLPYNNCQTVLIELRELLNDQFPSTATVIVIKQDNDYGYLSYGVNQDVCMIEIYPPICSENRLDLGIKFEQSILLKYGGSVHWSKQLISINDMSNLTDNSVTNFYNDFNTFNNIRQLLDPNNIFLNEYTQRIFNDNSNNIINYPLIDQYRKNSKSWEFVGWYSIIIPIIVTFIIAVLNLMEKFNEKLLLYNNDYKWKYIITMIIVISIECILAVAFHFIIASTVDI